MPTTLKRCSSADPGLTGGPTVDYLMQDNITSANRCMNALVALDVPFYDLDLRHDVEQVLPPTRGEVVEHAHLVPLLEQIVHQMRPNKAAPSGDQHAHVGDPSEPPNTCVVSRS